MAIDFNFSRRNLLYMASVIFPVRALGLAAPSFLSALPPGGKEPMAVSDHFPSQPPELVREMVIVAHFDLKRVKELVEARPSLASAAWDWGFGDWETPLGAASHMGNRPIAEYLIARGAVTSLFSAAMFGQLEVVKALIAAQPGIQRIRGPHGISLIGHARMGGQAAHPVFEYLQSLGDADAAAPVALPEADATALAGSYTFGSGATEQVEVTIANPRMYVAGKMYTYPPQLAWTRKGTMERPLFHLGEHAFYPGGAPSVRIRFSDDAGAKVMTVNDADTTLTARKMAPAK